MKKNGYIWLDNKFSGARGKVKVQCRNGHIRDVVFSSIGKHECKTCSEEKKAKALSHDYDYVKSYFEKYGYTLISKEYKNSSQTLETICSRGHDYKTRFGNFKAGKRCMKCRKIDYTPYNKLNKEKVDSRLRKENYKLLSEEVNGYQEYLEMQCSQGHRFSMTWNSFSNGSRCPRCKESKGEKRIAAFLDSEGVEYTRQYKIEGCQSIRLLPFDFYLPSYNILIEFDGKQHYKIIDFFGGLEEFIGRKVKDTIKNEYCKKNNITLIRIPYWEFDNIENILKEKLENKIV